MIRRRPVWFRCSDPGRPNDTRMRWHYSGCPVCAAAARALGRGDVLAAIATGRL